MKLVLFDIDGPLPWTDGAGRGAIHRALLEETGTAGPIETYRFDGKTDPQIVRELLALAGHPGATDEQRIEAVCRRYVGLLSAELEKPTQATRLMVGIAELLLADRKSTRLNSSHSQISYAVFCLKKKTSLSPSAPLTLGIKSLASGVLCVPLRALAVRRGAYILVPPIVASVATPSLTGPPAHRHH